MTAEEFAAMERRARMFEAANEKMLADNKRLREENTRLMKENSELMLRAHALLSLLPPETTCGQVQEARAKLAAIREGGE